jgi:hypothetical protein
MSQYKTGTVSITNGSPIVTGSGTSWLANVSSGDSFKIKSENVVYSIASVDSDLQITLTISYVGVTASDLEYQIIVDFTPGLNIPEIWANDIDWPYHLTVGLRKIDTLFTGLITISKTSCRTATTTVLDCAYNSTALTLTANSNGAISIDGVSLVANDRVLVKNQNTQTQNGIYFVSTVGDGTHPYILTRATDFNSSAYIKAGVYTIIEEGTVNADSCWVLTTDNPITLDSSNLIFKCAYFAKAEYAPMTSCTDPATNTVGTTAIVDAYSGNVVTLTTTGNSQTLQSPTDTRTGSKFTVINNDTSTNTLTVNGITIPIGKAQTWIWDGTAWAEIDIGITTLPVPVIQGGTGLATVALGSILAANSLNVLSAITSTSGLKVLQNSDGVVSWGSTTGTGNIVFSTSPTLVTPALGTPSSGTLTNCTFPTLNQNTTGSSASLSISGQTGLLTFTGITSTNREKTVRNAADTLLELGGSYTPTGTWNWTSATATWPTFNQNTTGTAYNITQYTVNQNVGTSNSPTFAGLVVSGTQIYGILVDVTNSSTGKGFYIGYSTTGGVISARGGGQDLFFAGGGSSGYGDKGVLIDTNGNIGIGATTFGTSAAGVLAIKNNTAPSSSPADMIQLYAEDVAASSELKVRDEAGNVTTLSPHNFSLFQPDKSYVFPWSYYSRNGYIGKEINVDMCGVVKAIEELSGKKFMYIRDIPKSDWAANQEELRKVQDAKIKEAQNKVAALTSRIDELTEVIKTLVGDDKKAAKTELEEVSKTKEEIVIPTEYVTKPIPQWIADRLK